MVYTVAEVQAALKSGTRVWGFRYERVDKNGVPLQDEVVQQCSVANNSMATEVKRTCRVTLAPGSDFNYLSHSLRPWARLRMPDAGYVEWCMGTFLLAQPTTTPDRPTQPVDTDGYDWLLKLTEAKMPGRVTSADTGLFGTITTYYQLITGLLTLAGFVGTPNIQYIATTLPKAFEWEPGTSFLQMINECLASLNYRPLKVDAFGVPTSTSHFWKTGFLASQIKEPSPVWQYTRDGESVIINQSTTVDLDTWKLPNQWVGYVSEPDMPPLQYVKTNSSPSDPLSTYNRGRTITRILTAEEVGKPPDLAALTAIVDRYSAEVHQQYQEVTFSTGLMPFHGDSDIVWLDYGDGSGLIKFQEHSWDAELRAGGTMKHVVRRTVAV